MAEGTKTPADLCRSVAHFRESCRFTERFGKDVDELVAWLGSRETSCSLAFSVLAECLRPGFQDSYSAARWLSSLWRKQPDACGGGNPPTLQSLHDILGKAKGPSPMCARGKKCVSKPNLVRFTTLGAANRMHFHGTTRRIRDYRRFAYDLKKGSRVLKGFLRPNQDSKFVTTSTSVTRAKETLPPGECMDGCWPDRLRDLLGLWGMPLRNQELVEVRFTKETAEANFVRTPTVVDAGGYPEFLPACRDDGWGETVDGRGSPEGLDEAMLVNEAGWSFTLSYLGHPRGFPAGLGLSELNILSRARFVCCKEKHAS